MNPLEVNTMKLIFLSIAIVIIFVSSANAAKPVASDVKRANTAIQAEKKITDATVVDTKPAMPVPPPGGCGDFVYQWIPGESGSVDLESLNETNKMLELALEAANLSDVESSGSIEADLFAKATAVAEFLERMCRTGNCTTTE